MKTLTQTVAYCKQTVTHPTPAVKEGGLCLQFCREAWSAPLIGAHTANDAWDMTNAKHLDSLQPPQGSLLYFNTGRGKAGHVAIADNDYWCWSTDIVTHGRLTRVPVSRIIVSWGATYRGWCSSYGTHKLPLF